MEYWARIVIQQEIRLNNNNKYLFIGMLYFRRVRYAIACHTKGNRTDIYNEV